ncbi:hypothetical protein PpBr36_02252 [Pyricularia pennisetigena]|uniref:hypothetical protein n=1 Tax=Pyricularia pennisetigena TaxID=1578925 RepID=UPI001153FC35|nr:hypothetical protein PpBr36_02252 [Pyricularia pennisetigena]TLS30949.1 hypothetical protein PpBr36_02252 [Pyricularia pennisetigena]
MCCFFTFMWLLATTSLAFPTGDKSYASRLGATGAFKPLQENIEGYYPKINLPLSSYKRSITPTITGRHFTKEEYVWLQERSLADVSVAGFKETTIAFNNLFGENDIPWVISGGWALILYGEPQRTTPDIDIIVQTTMPNLKKLLETDGRFLIPAENWWPDKSHLEVFFRTKNKYINVDIIIAGQKSSAKEIAGISKYLSMTYNNAQFSAPLIRPGPLFISKVLSLVWPKRRKTSQDVKDITYLVNNYYNELTDAVLEIPLQKRLQVVNHLNLLNSNSVQKVRELFKIRD